ncbi:MAG: hypothetical protein IPO78_17680 [Saprospiraceae bacterium]|nr:hypothetical protein [Saprospiraceae bacterium]
MKLTTLFFCMMILQSCASWENDDLIIREPDNQDLTSSGYIDEGVLDLNGSIESDLFIYIDGKPVPAIGDSDKGDITLTSSGTIWEIDNSVLLDSDCDGIADSQDLRNGGNDAIDLNNDNLPDIVYLVDYATLNPAWKCGAPYQEKAYCCKKTLSGFITICTYYSAFQAHINKGGYCGQCNEANCN